MSEVPSEVREVMARAFATTFVPAYADDAIWSEDVPALLRRRGRSAVPTQDNPFAFADAALSALTVAGYELNKAGTVAGLHTLNNVRAELTARAKEMQSARDTLIWIRDELEDEGDRVYFGSTNHAEQFREVVESMDEWSWHDIMRASRDTDYIGQGRIAAQKRDDLAMLVRRIIYRHSKELPLEEVLAAADDYLARNQLNGSPLRDDDAMLTASKPKDKADV